MSERIVVVGNGMAATRLVESLVARGVREGITVLGDERHPPYNRILLSAVLEGTHRPSALTLRSEQWYADHGVELRLGSRVVDLHRDIREVELADRSRVPYDRLVLATGSNPSLPPIRGLVRLDGSLHPAVHAFRSLDDCGRLLDALQPVPEGNVRRAVVVGGGLLGLQVARALSVRGLDVEVVEGGDHLLRSQVDARAGAVLKRSLTRLGTTVYTGARAVRLLDTPREDGSAGPALRLDNGFVLDTDLVVLTAGGRPSANLARRAGLSTHRGVVVDDTLASPDDDRVYAIGDCAEHAGRTTGFVAPAWEQAQLLAARLTGEPVAYEGARIVARLRATGLDVAVLGDERSEGEVVEVTNPIAGTHRKLVVRDGRVVAATLVGDLSQIGVITQHFDRGTVLAPSEPGALLMPSIAAPTDEERAAALPDAAEVCACAGVSAGALRACASLEEARETTRATTGCGGCATTVRALVRESVSAVSP